VPRARLLLCEWLSGQVWPVTLCGPSILNEKCISCLKINFNELTVKLKHDIDHPYMQCHQASPGSCFRSGADFGPAVGGQSVRATQQPWAREEEPQWVVDRVQLAWEELTIMNCDLWPLTFGLMLLHPSVEEYVLFISRVWWRFWCPSVVDRMSSQNTCEDCTA
jgi:hypothetical protein